MLNYEFLLIALGEAGEIGNHRFHNSEFIIQNFPSDSYRHALRAQVLFQAADGVRLIVKYGRGQGSVRATPLEYFGNMSGAAGAARGDDGDVQGARHRGG